MKRRSFLKGTAAAAAIAAMPSAVATGASVVIEPVAHTPGRVKFAERLADYDTSYTVSIALLKEDGSPAYRGAVSFPYKPETFDLRRQQAKRLLVKHAERWLREGGAL